MNHIITCSFASYDFMDYCLQITGSPIPPERTRFNRGAFRHQSRRPARMRGSYRRESWKATR